MASATNMSRVLDIVGGEGKDARVVLVASAISGATDALLSIAGGDATPLEELKIRHFAIVERLFTGEERDRLNARIEGLFREMEAAPDSEKVTFGELLSTTILCEKLRTEGWNAIWLDSRALVVKDDLSETYRRIASATSGGADIYVAPGFICCTSDGKVSTLGRGGSDYSAALYAAALNAASLQIWTDVPGIMTADPRKVPAARTVPLMSYGAALDMASHGAKVLYAPTVAPAMEKGLDIEIRNTFDPGGRFTRISAVPDSDSWIGVSAQGNTLRVTGSSDGEAAKAVPELRTALEEQGIAAIEIKPDGPSLNITLRPEVMDQGLRAIHRALFQTGQTSVIPVFIAGYGAVGKALEAMIEKTRESVAARSGKSIRIVGIAAHAGDYLDEFCRNAERGSVFVDCTPSETIWMDYDKLFRAGVNVVTSNRRSLSIPYVDYAALHASARENGVFFRYETTVGAALPMLESISRGANSLDEILSIEAVVSCTLNQILSEYRPGRQSFARCVRQAQAVGLTEQDPRMDLGGRDALRKLLILSREAGVHLEEGGVQITPLIPHRLFNMPLDRFYEELEALEGSFEAAYTHAAENGCRLRFVASLEKLDGTYRAGIRIREVAQDHPAYHLKGTENAIIIRSSLKPYPLVIQGPGEGAAQAASSLLNEILR